MFQRLYSRPFVRDAILAMTVVMTGVFVSPALGDDDEPTFNQLAQQMRKAHRNGNFEKSLELSQKMHEMRPDDTRPIYNIACAHCLMGDKAKAFDWLEKAIAKGYSDADHMANDFDLRTIRGEPRFRRMLKELRDRKRKPRKKVTEEPAEKPEKKDEPKESAKDKSPD